MIETEPVLNIFFLFKWERNPRKQNKMGRQEKAPNTIRLLKKNRSYNRK
jgi:hypothetical protein